MNNRGVPFWKSAVWERPPWYLRKGFLLVRKSLIQPSILSLIQALTSLVRMAVTFARLNAFSMSRKTAMTPLCLCSDRSCTSVAAASIVPDFFLKLNVYLFRGQAVC